jgi:hypothetical protein
MWGFVLTLLSGCPSSGHSIGETCDNTGDCRSDLQCLKNHCTPLCQSHLACGDGYTCNDGFCIETISNIGDLCSHELECGTGQACKLDPLDIDDDGQLAASCQSDQQGATTGTACTSDDDCRNYNCALGRCTELCTSNDDCPEELACMTIPRLLDNSAPTFRGCLQSTGTLHFDIPVSTPHAQIRVPVPSNAISFAMVSRVDDDMQLVGAARVESPSGDLLYATPFSPEQFYQNPLRHQPTHAISTLIVPNTPLIDLETGAYIVEVGSFFEAGGTGTAIPTVTIIYKLGPATILDLHLRFLNLIDHPCSETLEGTLDAEAAQEPGDFQDIYLFELHRIFHDSGLVIGDISYEDLPNQPHLDGINTSNLATLLRLSSDDQGITIYFVRSINPTGIIALAGGNPGPPEMTRTADSGIVVSIDTLCYRSWAVVAHATAHEIGRYLGLFRNREPEGTEPEGAGDPIPDSDLTENNLMYFGEETDGITLSNGQQEILKLYPGLR